MLGKASFLNSHNSLTFLAWNENSRRLKVTTSFQELLHSAGNTALVKANNCNACFLASDICISTSFCVFFEYMSSVDFPNIYIVRMRISPKPAQNGRILCENQIRQVWFIYYQNLTFFSSTRSDNGSPYLGLDLSPLTINALMDAVCRWQSWCKLGGLPVNPRIALYSILLIYSAIKVTSALGSIICSCWSRFSTRPSSMRELSARR